MATTILLVDDHALFRKGLRLLLEEEPGMSVVGEAGNGKEAIEKLRELSPEILIMDINMPVFNGIDVTRQIVSEVPSAICAVTSMGSAPIGFSRITISPLERAEPLSSSCHWSDGFA